MKRWWPFVVWLAVALLAAAALVASLNFRDEGPVDDDVLIATPEQVQRGSYLARAGNCVACHTMRGGAPYAGGRAIETPFGVVFGSNITPDEITGIGRWSASHFWRAMHNGRSQSGRFLVPAFPYTDFTRVTREDSNAIYAYLRTVPPVKQPNRDHALRFPYNTQVALAIWRAMFFQPGTHRADSAKSDEWNRGSYLVHGLGHCNACHGGRNLFGVTSGSLTMSGGVSPIDKWYAPSLAASGEAGVAEWETQHIVDLLKTGVSARGSALGPMAEVVFRSTQYLSEADLRAMGVFLKSLPQTAAAAPREVSAPAGESLERGRSVYRAKCEGCHGPEGEGARGAYPALAGNRSVVMDPPVNVVRAVLSGGFQPATAGNPRPWGMPPFGHVLDDADIAAVVTFIRNQWGNRATAVSENQVQRLR
ncbi:MAG: c-type cytochrome [Burkholderiaceae bacterium]